MSLGLNYTIPYQLLLITLRTLIATIPSEMFQQMLEDQQDELLVEYYARNIANPLLKVDVLKGLYRKYFLKNQNERASSFLQEALNSAEAIRGGKRRMETFTKLAELASQLGDNYQARSIRTLLRFT